MRGIPSLITDIRKKVFTEVARMAYEGGDYTRAEDLPYIIVPGDQPLHRESVFLERAIAGERVRLAMGLSIRPIQTRSLMTEGMDAAAVAEQYTEKSHLIQVSQSTQSAAAADSLKSCPTLCDPTDGSPPGCPIPGILQARTLEWLAISFSSA